MAWLHVPGLKGDDTAQPSPATPNETLTEPEAGGGGGRHGVLGTPPSEESALGFPGPCIACDR